MQHISAHLIEEGEFLIRKSHAEYWLKMGCKKLEPIDCACEDSVDDMGRLKASIVKAERMRAEEKLVADAKVRSARGSRHTHQSLDTSVSTHKRLHRRRESPYRSRLSNVKCHTWWVGS